MNSLHSGVDMETDLIDNSHLTRFEDSFDAVADETLCDHMTTLTGRLALERHANYNIQDLTVADKVKHSWQTCLDPYSRKACSLVLVMVRCLHVAGSQCCYQAYWLLEALEHFEQVAPEEHLVAHSLIGCALASNSNKKGENTAVAGSEFAEPAARVAVVVVVVA